MYSRHTISLFLATILFVPILTVEINTLLHLFLYSVLYATISLLFNIALDKSLFGRYLRITVGSI
ncbi:MAG: hypothetical protein DDT32_01862 [Syntrophomonadaceae bacterium]|nr:hypothetical protein [Bacillota bacterium]